MLQKKINPIIQWWVTPKLPYHDVFELPLLISKSIYAKYKHIFSQWIIHPVKRRLARLYLKFLQKFTDIKVIGITGSAGKTTTKEMLFSILKKQDMTVCTKTYIDPIYNIPNTILSTPPGTKYLILEMGVEYPGEMDFYLWLAKPNIGVITNIFPTHLEFLGDINGVLKEKAKLVLTLERNDIAVLNSDDKNLKSLTGKIKARICWFKSKGDQFAINSEAAMIVASYLGISKDIISKGLDNYRKPQHRLNLISLKTGAVVLDDSYNSNPQALLKTLEYFMVKAGKNKKIAVLGDMKELGEFEKKYHRELGHEVSKLNFKAVIGVGSAMKYLIDEIDRNNSRTKTYLVAKQEDLLAVLTPYLKEGNYILIKGSRSIGLDKLVDALV